MPNLVYNWDEMDYSVVDRKKQIIIIWYLMKAGEGGDSGVGGFPAV